MDVPAALRCLVRGDKRPALLGGAFLCLLECAVALHPPFEVRASSKGIATMAEPTGPPPFRVYGYGEDPQRAFIDGDKAKITIGDINGITDGWWLDAPDGSQIVVLFFDDQSTSSYSVPSPTNGEQLRVN